MSEPRSSKPLERILRMNGEPDFEYLSATIRSVVVDIGASSQPPVLAKSSVALMSRIPRKRSRGALSPCSSRALTRSLRIGDGGDGGGLGGGVGGGGNGGGGLGGGVGGGGNGGGGSVGGDGGGSGGGGAVIQQMHVTRLSQPPVFVPAELKRSEFIGKGRRRHQSSSRTEIARPPTRKSASLCLGRRPPPSCRRGRARRRLPSSRPTS